MSIFTKEFWVATAERATKSAVQGALVAIGATATFDALTADWRVIGGSAVSMALLSVLTSVGSAAWTSGPSPSLGNAETLPYEVDYEGDLEEVDLGEHDGENRGYTPPAV